MADPIHLTYKYRIKDKRLRKKLRAMAWSVNQVWNYCVAQQRDIEARYRAGAPKRRWASNYELQRLTSGTSVLLGLHADTIGQVCATFSQSRDKKRRAPSFRVSSGSRRSLGWIPLKADSYRITAGGVRHLGKEVRVFGLKSRPIPEAAKGGCFVEDAQGRWWLCLLVQGESKACGIGSVGIDLGLKALATTSAGETIPALQHYRQYERHLAAAQRAGNKRRVRAIHAKIANVRRDHIHKATTKIAGENGFIAIGNVSAPNLAKTRMAKSIHDASWGMFRTQLEYKARRHRATFRVVDEAWTSRTCSACGTIPTSSPKGMGGLGMRSWICSDCDAEHDRDVNAARNILRIGLSFEAHADGSRRAA